MSECLVLDSPFTWLVNDDSVITDTISAESLISSQETFSSEIATKLSLSSIFDMEEI